MDRTGIILATGPSFSHLHSLLLAGGWGVELLVSTVLYCCCGCMTCNVATIRVYDLQPLQSAIPACSAALYNYVYMYTIRPTILHVTSLKSFNLSAI